MKNSTKRLVWTIIGRTALMFFTIILLLLLGLVMILNLMFNGPSEAACKVLTSSLHEASATKWVPALFLGQEKVDQILYGGAEVLKDSQSTPTAPTTPSVSPSTPEDPSSPSTDPTVPPASVPDDSTSNPGNIHINMDSILNPNVDEWKNYPDGVRIEYVSGDTFNAYVMIIRDPSKVYLATSSEEFSKDVPGTRITDEIETQGAIAAINAGAFFDNGTSDKSVGSVPEGLVVAGGKVVWNSGAAPEQGFVGFNQDNVLVVAQTMTAYRAQELGIRDGCCFGPVLITNGEINEIEYNSNSGYNPRTAIGQRADGAVLFVCIDGRQTSSLGGTYADLIDIMVEYEAVNACNLDGGSSTVMLYRDQYGRYSGSDQPRYGANGDVVMINNYSLLQAKPRRMPTFFMVRPSEEG
ncbi:MAG: phosphodiester glycosidase family protein [Oscillospiraceae bacterium]|nr:phosphodiester glycosidase family protein [Oscillospiraceae bacterium]